MKVFTYYDPAVQQQKLVPPQDGLLTAWAASWSERGWEPRILSPRDAALHPNFRQFKAAMERHPTVNPKAYEMACYMRWLALERAGGGWMVDYDVINFSMRPRKGKAAVEMLDITYVPCAVWATLRGAKQILELLGNYPVGNQHTSDMIMFKSEFDSRGFGDPTGSCLEFGVPGWEKAPLVHFSASASRAFPCKLEAVQAAKRSAHAVRR